MHCCPPAGEAQIVGGFPSSSLCQTARSRCGPPCAGTQAAADGLTDAAGPTGGHGKIQPGVGRDCAMRVKGHSPNASAWDAEGEGAALMPACLLLTKRQFG